jgi:hypothetical protein
MHDNLTNLLPAERQHALVRDYAFRFGTVVLAVCIALILAAGVLLIPTYVLLEGSAGAKTAQLESIKLKLSSADEVALSARLAALAKDAAALVQLSKARSASAVVRSVLGVARPGIILTGFEYSSVRSQTPNTLVVSGIAATRDALRNYQLALQSQSFVASAVLPVSVYAQDTDIDFSVTITLKP